MHAMGLAFAVRQLRDLERMQNATPEEVGDMLGRAMISSALEELRANAGKFAYNFQKEAEI